MLKGNDYLLIWLLTEPDGTPIDYNQFDSYKVFIQNDSNKSYKYEVVTDALDDGLHFDFKADMQKSTGYYSLIFEAVKDGRNYKAECYRGVHIDGNVDKAQCVVGASNSTIKLTDCLSLYLGGRDGRSPYVGVNNHWWAFDDLQKAYADTGIQVDYSAEIGAQITLAEQAIARVNQTNQTVSENEIARSQNEAIREQEERTRVANEAKRVYDEELRFINELKRKDDEAARLSNETARKDSEAVRVNNEAARVSGEDVRVRNEASRTSEESTRVSNENARKSNEITRVNAESSRVSAEQSRVTEEGKRVAAETKRQADTAKAIQDTNTAAQNATNVAAGMEGKIVQIQQDVNTRFTEDEGHIKRESVHPLQGKATRMTTGMYGNLNININQSLRFFVKHNVDSGNYATLFGGIYLGGGTSLSFVTAPGQPQRQLWNDLRGNKLTEIVMTISETTMKLYKNGVLGFEFELTEGEKKAIQAGWRQRASEHVGVETIHFNHFNYVLSPEEVKELYNNGRPDKVVLGNEKKGKSFTHIPPIIGINQGTKEDVVFDGKNCTKITCIATPSSASFGPTYDFSIEESGWYVLSINYYSTIKYRKTASFGIDGQGCGSIVDVDENIWSVQKTLPVFLEKGITHKWRCYFSTYNNGDVAYFEKDSIKIERLNCIAEYLPSSLTPTTWFDTSGNNYHLTAAGTPELIYTPTFVDHIVKDVPPNIIPDFVGQKYTDKTAKVIYESVGMTAVSDWVQISK